MRWLLVLTILLVARPAEARREALTVTIVNPARADAWIFRVDGKQLEPMGSVHPGGTLNVRAFPGDVLRADFNCRRGPHRFKVPHDVAAEWRLPSRPCGGR